jgi:hypothetical protein
MAEQVHSFAIGDYVKMARRSANVMHADDLGREGHITAAEMNEGCLQYAFEGTAWYEHACFDLIVRATPNALAYVAKLGMDELEAEWESSDEGDDDAWEIKGDPIAAFAEWFSSQSDELEVSYEENPPLIKLSTRTLTVMDVLNASTTFALAPWNKREHNRTDHIVGDSLLIDIKYHTAFHAVVTIRAAGGDPDYLRLAWMDEFDPYQL